VFWDISVYFNIRNILLKSSTFLLGHPVYDEVQSSVRLFMVAIVSICDLWNFVTMHFLNGQLSDSGEAKACAWYNDRSQFSIL